MVIYPLIAIWTFAHAATLEVPTEYHTIQAAIDAARDGDEVVVAPGRYHGTISFNGKAITVQIGRAHV